MKRTLAHSGVPSGLIVFLLQCASMGIWCQQSNGTTWNAGFDIVTTTFPGAGSRGAYHPGSYRGTVFDIRIGIDAGTGSAALFDLEMERMLLYPPNSSWAFLPAAYQLPPSSGSSLSMSNCTITTLCTTVAAYTAFMRGNAPTSIVVGHGCMAIMPCRKAMWGHCLIPGLGTSGCSLRLHVDILTLSCHAWKYHRAPGTPPWLSMARRWSSCSRSSSITIQQRRRPT